MEYKIGQGRTATVYERDGRAIKVFNEGFPYSYIKREYDYGKLAFENRADVPEVFGISKKDGLDYIEYELIDGKTMEEMLIEDSSKAIQYAKIFAKIQSNIHTIKLERDDFEEFFIKRIGYIKEFDQEKIDYIIKYAKSLNRHISLCHGDFHPGNIMFSEDKTYIFDWMLGNSSNPLSDVCRTYLMLKTPLAYMSVPKEAREDVKGILSIFLKIYLDEYSKINNTNTSEIFKWLLPMASLRLLEHIPYEKEWLLNIIDEEIKKMSK